MPVLQEWFTVDEAAEYLRVSRRTIYELTRADKLPAYLLGKQRHRRFRRDDLDAVLRPQTSRRQLDEGLEMTAESDPVLAQMWDNEMDSAYDRL